MTHKLSKKMINAIGWLGTFALFAAYILNIFGYIPSTGLTYAFLNLVAAILLGIRVYADRNWSNVVLEIFFGLIAVISLVRYFFFN